jgi:hypothetical protein
MSIRDSEKVAESVLLLSDYKRKVLKGVLIRLN